MARAVALRTGALLLVILCAAVQLGSEGLYAHAASPASLVARVSPSLGERFYLLLERYTPSVDARLMLAQYYFGQRRYAEAERRLSGLPVVERSELAARLAHQRGDRDAEIAGYLAAGDLDAVGGRLDELTRAGHLGEADALARALVRRLQRSPTHPDALAEAWWRLGILNGIRARSQNGKTRSAMLRESLRDHEHAVALAPLSEKYLLAAGFAALDLHDVQNAREYFRRGIDVDPGSAQSYAGLARTAPAPRR